MLVEPEGITSNRPYTKKRATRQNRRPLLESDACAVKPKRRMWPRKGVPVSQRSKEKAIDAG